MLDSAAVRTLWRYVLARFLSALVATLCVLVLLILGYLTVRVLKKNRALVAD